MTKFKSTNRSEDFIETEINAEVIGRMEWGMADGSDAVVARQPVSDVSTWASRRGRGTETEEGQKGQNTQAQQQRRQSSSSVFSKWTLITRHHRRHRPPPPALVLFSPQPGVVTFDPLWLPGHSVALNLQLSVRSHRVEAEVKRCNARRRRRRTW